MNIKDYGFVCDSSLGVIDSYISKYDVKIAKLSLICDGNEIAYNTPNVEIMRLMSEGKRVTTSQPSQGDYLDCYQELINQGKKKIYVYTISRNLSGSFNSAMRAIEGLDEKDQDKVYVYDTLSVAQGASFYFYKTIELLEKNENIDHLELVKKLDEMRQNSYLLFIVDNLDTIYKNGRLGKVKYIIGSLLRIKPILRYQMGELEIVSRQLSMKASLNYMINKVKKELEDQNKKVTIYVSYVDNKENYEKLYELLEQEFKDIEIMQFGEIPQIVSAHIGPGGLGLHIGIEEK